MTNWQDLLALAIVAASAIGLLVRLARGRGGAGCGGCSGCASHEEPVSGTERPLLNIEPFTDSQRTER